MTIDHADTNYNNIIDTGVWFMRLIIIYERGPWTARAESKLTWGHIYQYLRA